MLKLSGAWLCGLYLRDLASRLRSSELAIPSFINKIEEMIPIGSNLPWKDLHHHDKTSNFFNQTSVYNVEVPSPSHNSDTCTSVRVDHGQAIIITVKVQRSLGLTGGEMLRLVIFQRQKTRRRQTRTRHHWHPLLSPCPTHCK
jgi:hypothetical protein